MTSIRSWWLEDAAATQRLAAAAANARPPPDEPRLIALRGELGAGKTSFVQDYLAACGVREPVRSPTYTLVESYADPRGGRIVHADLYRLAEPLEFEELGLREEFHSGCTWLVEWPERAASLLPTADIEIRLAIEGAGRRATFEGATPGGAAWVGLLPELV